MDLPLSSRQPNYRLYRSVTLVKAVGLLSLVFFSRLLVTLVCYEFVHRNFDYFLNKLLLLPCIHKKKSSSLKRKQKPALLGFEKLL